MQEALKKSNTNVLELKETINELILKDKKNKSKIYEVEKENENLKNLLKKYTNSEHEYVLYILIYSLKSKMENLKMENQNLNQNLNFTSDFQKKYEEVLKDNKSLRRKEDENERKIDKLNFEIESKQKANEYLCV